MIKKIGSIFTILLLAGCASNSVPTQNTQENMLLHAIKIPDSQSAQHVTTENLREAASQVTTSLNHLAALEQARTPKTKLSQPLNAKKIGMNQLASVDWTGPVEPLLKKLAFATHYKLNVLGNAPTVPILVSLNVSNVTMADVYRNIKFQTERFAHIALYPKQHVIELRYHSA
jgi:defect in organelle trafficking protein DotD